MLVSILLVPISHRVFVLRCVHTPSILFYTPVSKILHFFALFIFPDTQAFPVESRAKPHNLSPFCNL